jgi:Ca2+-binding EF-hand superfamily protein
MGGRNSTLVGKAAVDERLMRFTAWGKDELKAMHTRHFHDLGGKFALGPRQTAMLLGIDEELAHPIFGEIFDTDKNQLVDAFEIIGAMAMLSKLSIREKVDMIHQLYDFNGSGDITIDEMTIMFRTVAVGCAKMDAKVIAPPVAEIEDLAAWAFRKADRDNDGEITRAEFDVFVFTSPTISHFLSFFAGAMNEEVIAPGTKFTDPDLATTASTLYDLPGAPPVGGIPAEEVGWLRPEEFMPGTPKLFDPKKIGAIKQGQMSDAWLLNALTTLAAKPTLLRSLFVPTGQEEHGRFCVRFFTEGKATHMIIDDVVPCNALQQPLFARSADPCEIWPMLIEKAYAKLYGCFEVLNSGSTEAALADLLGGTVETTKLHAKAVSCCLSRALRLVTL